MVIGGKSFHKGHTYVMGILNVTPDSFFDGGSYRKKEDLRNRIRQLVEEGCDIIDVGGESTRPGFQKVEADEEMERVIPALEEIRNMTDLPISVDTYKAEVAREAVKAGASLINNVKGCKEDPDMLTLIAKTGIKYCLMHHRNESDYKDFPTEILRDLQEALQRALSYGVKQEQMIVDPGVGFGKTVEENLWILHHLEAFHCLGYPLLLGASNKSVIGKSMNLPVDQRLEGTLVTSVLACEAGYLMVRVHQVRSNKRCIDFTEKILHND